MLQVGTVTGLVCRAVRQLGQGATGRLGLKLTTGGIEVDVGGTRRFSEVATGGATVTVGLQVRSAVGLQVLHCKVHGPSEVEALMSAASSAAPALGKQPAADSVN